MLIRNVELTNEMILFILRPIEIHFSTGMTRHILSSTSDYMELREKGFRIILKALCI